MKRLFSIIACLLAVCVVQAQDYSIFTCNTPEECIVSSDSLLIDAKRQFKLEKSRLENRNEEYILYYTEINTESAPPKTIKVRFCIYMDGANPSLEIEGVKRYEFQSIQGAFLDLFPIYKKYIDPDADMVQVSEKGVAWKGVQVTATGIKTTGNKGSTRMFRLSGQENNWTFALKYQ